MKGFDRLRLPQVPCPPDSTVRGVSEKSRYPIDNKVHYPLDTFCEPMVSLHHDRHDPREDATSMTPLEGEQEAKGEQKPNAIDAAKEIFKNISLGIPVEIKILRQVCKDLEIFRKEVRNLGREEWKIFSFLKREIAHYYSVPLDVPKGRAGRPKFSGVHAELPELESDQIINAALSPLVPKLYELNKFDYKIGHGTGDEKKEAEVDKLIHKLSERGSFDLLDSFGRLVKNTKDAEVAANWASSGKGTFKYRNPQKILTEAQRLRMEKLKASAKFPGTTWYQVMDPTGIVIARRKSPVQANFLAYQMGEGYRVVKVRKY